MKDNFLDYIPEKKPSVCYGRNADGRVVILVKHKGFFHWIAQKSVKTPEITKVQLDEMGSFIWAQIDGERNIYEIGKKVKEEYREEAQPLYERLTMYMKLLNNQGFITFLIRKNKS